LLCEHFVVIVQAYTAIDGAHGGQHSLRVPFDAAHRRQRRRSGKRRLASFEVQRQCPQSLKRPSHVSADNSLPVPLLVNRVLEQGAPRHVARALVNVVRVVGGGRICSREKIGQHRLSQGSSAIILRRRAVIFINRFRCNCNRSTALALGGHGTAALGDSTPTVEERCRVKFEACVQDGAPHAW
jgi:hypothetical protein